MKKSDFIDLTSDFEKFSTRSEILNEIEKLSDNNIQVLGWRIKMYGEIKELELKIVNANNQKETFSYPLSSTNMLIEPDFLGALVRVK